MTGPLVSIITPVYNAERFLPVAQRRVRDLQQRQGPPRRGAMKDIDVIVAGGGIGGLSLALSLHQAGIAVRVYERCAISAPLGVGINLQPTAVRELTELGLADALAETGIATRQLNLCDKFGQLIHEERRGLAAGYRWPQYSIHRGELQLALLRAVRDRIGDENVRNGLKLTGFEQDAKRVRVRFADRQSGSERMDAEASALVGADGIHSAVRHQLYPAEGAPRFAQQMLWRAAVEAELPEWRDHRRCRPFPSAYHGLSHRRGSRTAGAHLNWICQKMVPERAPPREDWNRRVAKEKVLAAFGGWKFPWLDLPALIEQSTEIYEFPLVDRDPVEAWSFGRVTLLGDAAHPMQPIGGQAGSQAILDARALTRALSEALDPVAALLRYDRERRPAMNDVTLRNRNLGPEAAMQLAEERAPNGARVRRGNFAPRA